MRLDYNKIFDKLYPLNRSITGEGYRKSLEILSKFIKFKIIKFKSGKKIFDWTVPKEWHVNQAFLKNLNTNKVICSFKKDNLSIVNYSTKINKKLKLKDFKSKLYTLKSQPNHTPYVTSYYKKDWGFCLNYKKFKKLNNKDNYHLLIDSSFNKGSVDLGIKILKGRSKKFFLISSYLCHPSMANNELSGPLTLLGLYDKLKNTENNFTYMFLINPETIGSICFLNKYWRKLKKELVGGLVLTCTGGPKQKLSYKLSKTGQSNLDKLYLNLSSHKLCDIRKFDASEGSDERQYNSPGFNFPIGQISRTVYGQYKEYHTSGDNKKFMKIEKIENSIDEIFNQIRIFEKIHPLKRKMPFCELQLGKRELYPNVNFKSFEGKNLKENFTRNILNILSYADGKNTLLDIANILNVPVYSLEKEYDTLKEKKLII